MTKSMLSVLFMFSLSTLARAETSAVPVYECNERSAKVPFQMSLTKERVTFSQARKKITSGTRTSKLYPAFKLDRIEVTKVNDVLFAGIDPYVEIFGYTETYENSRGLPSGTVMVMSRLDEMLLPEAVRPLFYFNGEEGELDHFYANCKLEKKPDLEAFRLEEVTTNSEPSKQNDICLLTLRSQADRSMRKTGLLLPTAYCLSSNFEKLDAMRGNIYLNVPTRQLTKKEADLIKGYRSRFGKALAVSESKLLED